MEDVPADLLVLADEDRTVQVMVNLLSNAIKFSRPGSSVTVTTEVGNDDVLVKVIDQGRGIATADLSKVFERFKQLEAADATRKGGSGLGLHICRKIIEQMNGTIGVESELGKGSTFYFKLPRQLPVKLDAPAQPKKC